MKKLGRLPARRDHRVKALAKYTRALALAPPPPVPPHHGLAKSLDFPMSLNDQIGDCTAAGWGHIIQLWTAAAGVMRVPTDAEVLAVYEQTGGYDPQDPNTDRGAVEQDVLQAWLKGLQGDTLEAYAAINTSDLDEMRDAICWFGGAYIGVNLPQSALDDDALWDYVPGSGIVGGHCVVLLDYDIQRPSDGRPYFYGVSWGKLIAISDEFLTHYLDEAYALLNKDFIRECGKTPGGLDLNQLVADMQAIRAQ